jgi:hypothetical protein
MMLDLSRVILLAKINRKWEAEELPCAGQTFMRVTTLISKVEETVN